MTPAALSGLLGQMAETQMSRTALIKFIENLAQQMGSQMQLCCGRALGNLPSPRRECEGRLA